MDLRKDFVSKFIQAACRGPAQRAHIEAMSLMDGVYMVCSNGLRVLHPMNFGLSTPMSSDQRSDIRANTHGGERIGCAVRGPYVRRLQRCGQKRTKSVIVPMDGAAGA